MSSWGCCIAVCIYVCFWHFKLDKTAAKTINQVLVCRYLKTFVECYRELRIKRILLDFLLVILSETSLKRGLSFTYCYPQKFYFPDFLTCILSFFHVYDIHVIWIFYIVWVLRIQVCKYFHCYLLTALYKFFLIVSENMILVKTFIKSYSLTNFLFIFLISNFWLSFFMGLLLSFTFCAP